MPLRRLLSGDVRAGGGVPLPGSLNGVVDTESTGAGLVGVILAQTAIGVLNHRSA